MIVFKNVAASRRLHGEERTAATTRRTGFIAMDRTNRCPCRFGVAVGAWRRFVQSCSLLVVFPTVALAGQPVAIVESVSGAPPSIESMDYLSAGQVFVLGEKDRVVIDYLYSCMRETIGGGTVSIGTERSTIKGGNVERERVRCDGGRMQLSPEQSQLSAGGVVRVPPKSHPLPPGTVIERRLYGTSPIFDLSGKNRIVVERLDLTEDRVDLLVTSNRLVRGRFFDLLTEGRSLSPGGVYRVTAGDRSVVFQIDRLARTGKTPIASRLLQF